MYMYVKLILIIAVYYSLLSGNSGSYDCCVYVCDHLQLFFTITVVLGATSAIGEAFAEEVGLKHEYTVASKHCTPLSGLC